MSLDLAETLRQIETVARRLSGGRYEWSERLGVVLEAMRSADPSEVKRKTDSNEARPYLYAGLTDGLAGRHSPQPVPDDFCVTSVDGSHIDVDRHTPVRCYLINVGGGLLTYGSHADARLFSRPRLYSEEEDLYITNIAPDSREAVALEGALVGLKRTVEEVKGLASMVEEAPPGLPVLALIDGSLVLWGLAGRGYQPFVRDDVLRGGLIPALDRLREMAPSRTLAVAAYTSLPQSREVVNALRLFLCKSDVAECRRTCVGYSAGRAPCDAVNGFMDRHLFQELLEPGERSSLYRANSSISKEYYGPHQVYFYYMNTGQEIARIEMPEWVARQRKLLELSHSLVLDQCRRGMGYPAAISEAHEQAVITAPDREAFRQLVDSSLAWNHLPVYTSEKARSKRMRWL